MRTFVDTLDVRPCRTCGREALRFHDLDGCLVQLEPEPVIGIDAMHHVGPRREAWGWSFTGRYWRVHRFAEHPLAYAFLEHSCIEGSNSSLTKGDSMTADPFGTPAPPGASGPSMAELEGRLILITVNSIERGITTSAGVSDAAVVDLVDLTSGEAHHGTYLWGKVLINQLAASPLGTKYVGRIGKGQAQTGKNAPWIWVDGSPEDKATGVKYLTYAAGQSVAAAPTPAAPPAAPAPAAFAPPPAAPAPVPAATPAAAPPWAQ